MRFQEKDSLKTFRAVWDKGTNRMDMRIRPTNTNSTTDDDGLYERMNSPEGFTIYNIKSIQTYHGI